MNSKKSIKIVEVKNLQSNVKTDPNLYHYQDKNNKDKQNLNSPVKNQKGRKE